MPLWPSMACKIHSRLSATLGLAAQLRAGVLSGVGGEEGDSCRHAVQVSK